MRSITAKYGYAVSAITAWFAVVTQLYLNVSSGAFSLSKTLIIFFSYFTILTNILVAVCSTAIVISGTRNRKFFTKQETLAAAAMYITVVALIYNLVLRSIWSPTGMQRFVDKLLHVGVPLFFVLLWLVTVPKNKLTFKDALLWMLYPLLYIVFIMIRGYASGYYPYPFADIAKLGLQQVLVNAAGITGAFLLSGLLFIGGAKMFRKKDNL